jgi:transcriptional regulator with XRE-family HTH domain
MVNGAELRYRRERAGLLQSELAERVGVSHVMIGHIEQGYRQPSVATLVLIAKALDCTVDALLRDTAHSTPA